jgi:peroxiredoxin
MYGKHVALALAALLVAGFARAEDDPTLLPSKAWAEVEKARQAARQARDGRAFRGAPAAIAKPFLEKWDKAGKTVSGLESLDLGRLYDAVGRAREALASFEQCAGDESVDVAGRRIAMLLYCRALQGAAQSAKLKPEELMHGLKLGEEFIASMPEEADAGKRGPLRLAIASAYASCDADEEAIAHFLAAAHDAPAYAYSAGRQIMSILQSHGLDPARRAGVKKQAGEIAGTLRSLQRKHIRSIEDGGNPRRVASANRTLQRMEKMTATIDRLGETAPEWTLQHSYGKGKALADYRGKVVVLDFWATWCPWCIRSFPAIRDVLRDYKDQDLVFVGVTASASAVWDARYDLDDDLKEKSTGKASPPTARRPRAPTRAADDTDETFAEKQKKYAGELTAYQTKERETIATFINNHGMTWDVVMIDAAEPAAKYALGGWPHAVVIDREGRIRYFKSGALLRDRPEAVKKFRKVLDTLLAEKKAD